jgi:release factor glutamine methyltransferase
MNFLEAKKYFFNECASLLDEDESEELFSRIIEDQTGLSKIDLLANKSIELNLVTLNSIIDDLKKHKPIQYILGYEWFGKFKLHVTENTLIPRPETEELVLWIVETLKEKNNQNAFIIDIGTGSGCIPIYLKSTLQKAEILAMDINQKTIEVAIQNAKNYAVDIDFFQDDILNLFHAFSEKFDVIVSNPPYILETEKKGMSKRVIAYEPHEALFVTNNDPLQFYRSIVSFAKNNLKKDGFLFFETHQDYAEDVFNLCIQNGFQTELKKDMYENNRMVKAVMKD